MEWINVNDRLPQLKKEGDWRSDRAYPVMSESVGLTYAYFTDSGFIESHIYGDRDGNKAPTDGTLAIQDVVQWLDIKTPDEIEAPMPDTEWLPWSAAEHFASPVNVTWSTALIRFESGHIEDAVIHLDEENETPYFALFDDQTFSEVPVSIMPIPDETDPRWTPWKMAAGFRDQTCLIRFENGHIEDATVYLNDDGHLDYRFFDHETMSCGPVAVMRIPD